MNVLDCGYRNILLFIQFLHKHPSFSTFKYYPHEYNQTFSNKTLDRIFLARYFLLLKALEHYCSYIYDVND